MFISVRIFGLLRLGENGNRLRLELKIARSREFKRQGREIASAWWRKQRAVYVYSVCQYRLVLLTVYVYLLVFFL